jgi:phage shock protein A
MLQWIVVAVVVVAAFFVVDGIAGRRFSRYLLNKIAGAGLWAERNDDPVAGMQRVADNMKTQMTSANEALTTGQALEEELEEKVRDGKAEKARLEARIADLDAKTNKTPADQQLLQDYATKYARVEADLETNEAAWKAQVEDNARFLTQAQEAAEQIESIEAEARSMGVQVKTAEAREQFGKMVSKFGGVANGVSEAEKFKELAKAKIRKANAQVTVNEKLETAAERIARHEKGQKGNDVLDRLRAKRATTPGS